jgi:hypothetical protein
VHPDLVRAAGLEPDLEQRVGRQLLEQLEVGDRVARCRGVERVPRPVEAVAPDRRLDAPRPRLRPSLDEGEVAALDLPAPDQLLQAGMRLLGAGDDEQPRGVAVEAVDDAGPLLVAPRRVERDEPVDERATPLPPRRMDDDSGRLVDDERCSSSQAIRKSMSSASKGPAAAGSSTTTSSPPSSR